LAGTPAVDSAGVLCYDKACMNFQKNIRDTSKATDGSLCVLDTGQRSAESVKRAAPDKTCTSTIIHMTDSVGNDCQTSQEFVSHATELSMRFIGGIDERASGLLH
jgi:hypothetical protein